MRRVNLLPPDDRRRRGAAAPAASRTGIIGLLLILGALLVMAMIGLYLFYFIRVGNEEEQITQLDQDIARQQARLDELAPYKDLQARLDAKKPIADGIFRTRFPWDEFLNGLAFVIPEATALDVFTGTASPINVTVPPAGEGPAVQPLDPPGTITFDGFADRGGRLDNRLNGYQNVADFVVRMNNLRFLTNADLNAAARNDADFSGDGAITFQVRAELVTRVGEFGDEALLAEPEEGEEQGGGDGADEPQGEPQDEPQGVPQDEPPQDDGPPQDGQPQGVPEGDQASRSRVVGR